MTYDDFKKFLLTHLWKVGDSVVFDNLDVIVKTAEAALNRDLKVESRAFVSQLSATSNIADLPSDYRQLRSLVSPTRGEMTYNIPSDFANKRAAGTAVLRDYTVVNKQLHLIGPITPEDPLDLEVWYYRKMPSFPTLPPTEENWLLDDYFDVYLYAVLKHTAPFLREDERLATWGALFTDAMASAMDENTDLKFAGAPLKIKFPSGVR